VIRSCAKSKWFEVKADRGLADTQQAGNLGLTPSLFHKSSDENTPYLTLSGSDGVTTPQMLGVSGTMQFQVLDPVVDWVTVDVVDDLFRVQRPTKFDFHEPTVFQHRHQSTVTPYGTTSVSLRSQMDTDDGFRSWPVTAVQSFDPAWVRAVGPCSSLSWNHRNATSLAGGCHSQSLTRLKTEYGRTWRPLLLAYLERVGDR
jgi:hypothetical protein